MSEDQYNDIEIKTIQSDHNDISLNHHINTNSVKLPNSKNPYSGLVNQGRTCYMNSLLQSLFMTPEFRLKILNWEYNSHIHGSKLDSIPYQLKKLFARMQMRYFEAEKTISLTKSFQWNAGEIYQQHDIQELCRVLFDAIKVSFSGDEDFIDELFQGITSGVIKCLDCGNSRQRNDIFLDLTLPVRNLFENIHNSSLEMALKNYLKPEELNNENKVYCEVCDKKCDALKYVQFYKLPKILFFQLGRFDYDYNTSSRIKINDRVTFPEVLNMNRFLKNHNVILSVYNDETLKNLIERKHTNVDERNKEIDLLLKEGPYVYELYSILIHSGTSNGGHYFAYIKSFENGNWYNFNDSSVSLITVDHFQNIYGGANKSSITAYILMYRIINKFNDIANINDSLICQDLKNELEIENEKIKEEERIEKEKACNIIIKFKLGTLNKEITFKNYNTVKELKLQAMKQLEVITDEKNVRLRVIDVTTNRLLDSFGVEEFTLEESNIVSYKTYSLEIKSYEDKEFEEYDPTAIHLQVYLWKEINNEIDEKDFEFKRLLISRNSLLSNLKEKIYEIYNIERSKDIYCFKKLEFSTPELFNASSLMNKEICNNSIYDNMKIYVEIKNENWKGSLFLKVIYDLFKRLEKKNLNIDVSFNLPIAPEDLKNITINSYKFDNQIKILKTLTVKELKDRIGEYLGISINEFIIKKSSHYGDELNILSDSLYKFDADYINIYIEFGRPLGEDEIKITALYCDYDYTKFKIFPYIIHEFGSYIIDTNKTIKQLKEMLCEELKISRSIILNNEDVLIREHIIDKPTKIFPEEECIKHLNFNKGKRVVLQEYKKERLVLTNNNIQVTVREFDPSNWSLSEPIEIILEKKCLINDFINEILRYFPLIMKENLYVHKITTSYNVYLEDFHEKLQFDKLSERESSKLDGFPYFVNNDGSMFIIKDITKIYREPSDFERTSYCRPLPITTSEGTSTALVSVVENKKDNTNQPMDNSVKNMMSKFESLIVNPLANLWNSATKSGLFKIKEEGIKINVKKTNYEENKE